MKEDESCSSKPCSRSARSIPACARRKCRSIWPAIGRDARLLEEIGYEGLVVEETKDDPFILMALAAQATERLKIGTSVAIAFPRSPTVTAMSAWTLAKLSQGRFTLGLGSQVQGAYRAALRPAVVAGRPVDARIRQRRARGVGPLADRRAARREERRTTRST